MAYYWVCHNYIFCLGIYETEKSFCLAAGRGDEPGMIGVRHPSADCRRLTSISGVLKVPMRTRYGPHFQGNGLASRLATR